MDLKYKNPGFDYMLNSILDFQRDIQDDYFRESLFYFYPEIDRKTCDSLEEENKKEYIKSKLEQIYKEKELLMNHKIIDYQNYWDINRFAIQSAFEEEFKIDLSNEFNDMAANISLNPICPRYLESSSFDIFYLNSERGALGMGLHEIVHFIWFKLWNQYFSDDINEYENPHLKWVFSEIVVDPILGNKELKRLNPYYEEGCVYDYFYKMKVNGHPLMSTIRNMYKSNSMKDFMICGYQYFLDNEPEIRSQMK